MTARCPWRPWPSAIDCRPSSSSRSWPPSSTAVVRTTLGSHGGYTLAPGASATSLSHVIRLLDGALALAESWCQPSSTRPCSCPDEATCSLREAMIEVRDRMLSLLDSETLAETAARPGTPLLDPHNRHPEAARSH